MFLFRPISFFSFLDLDGERYADRTQSCASADKGVAGEGGGGGTRCFKGSERFVLKCSAVLLLSPVVSCSSRCVCVWGGGGGGGRGERRGKGGLFCWIYFLNIYFNLIHYNQ